MSALDAWQLGEIAPSFYVICLPFARDSVLSSSINMRATALKPLPDFLF